LFDRASDSRGVIAFWILRTASSPDRRRVSHFLSDLRHYLASENDVTFQGAAIVGNPSVEEGAPFLDAFCV
jgi:hypothetical protein